MGFRLRTRRKIPREFAEYDKFCRLAARLLPQGHVLTMNLAGGECSVCMNDDILHCEFQRNGRGIAIGARQPASFVNVANIMYAARLRFEEQASTAVGQVGHA